jgi:outer membrane protein assembly factor BamB
MRLITICSVIMGLLCSCCKTENEQGIIRPEWEAAIPTFESSEIFYPGLVNLPKLESLMIVPTTIYDGGFCNEDNRLCAIDINTGETKWFFPSNLESRTNSHFDSKGYLYNEKLIFQYVINQQKDTYLRATVCLNAKTGETLWQKDSRSSGVIKPVIGSNNDCYFIQDSCRVCKVDMDSDYISEFYYTGDDMLKINDIGLCDNYLVISCFCESALEDYSKETYVIVIETNTGKETLKKYLGYSLVPAHSFLEKNIIYSNLERKIMAVNLKTGNILWERHDECSYGFQDLCIYNDVLMNCSINATIGYDKNTGDVKYLFDDYGSYYVTQQGRYAYFINRKENVDIIEIETGKKLGQIICPNKSGFLGPYPTIYDNKLYIIGNNTLYRYPTYPWN